MKGIEGLVSVLSPEFPEIDFVKLASSKAGPEGSETDFTQEQERIRKIWLRARATEIDVFTCLALERGGKKFRERLTNYTSQFNKDTDGYDWRDFMAKPLRELVHKEIGSEEKTEAGSALVVKD